MLIGQSNTGRGRQGRREGRRERTGRRKGRRTGRRNAYNYICSSVNQTRVRGRQGRREGGRERTGRRKGRRNGRRNAYNSFCLSVNQTKLHWEKPIIWMVQYLLRSYRPLQILIMMEMLSYSVEWGAVLPLALTPRLLKATHEKNIHIQQKKACTWRTCISELMATRRILDYFSISPLQATAAAVVWMHCTLYDMDTVSYHGMGAAVDFLVFPFKLYYYIIFLSILSLLCFIITFSP